MQRKLRSEVRSAEEDLKAGGLVLDFDEIARRGSMSSDEVFIAKWYGIYNMRQPGSHMARVVVPGGVLTSSQARALAGISEKYGQGRLSITTRQSIQMHWLKCARLPDFLRELRIAGLTTFHGCGDVNRNVVACPWASDCPHRTFDVLPHAIDANKAFAADREMDNLPRKFKLSFSGCGACCSQPYMNDVGLVAITRRSSKGQEEHGFRVVIGGGHGWKAFVAQELYSFVPRELATEVCLAVGRLFRDHGDRWNRTTSRLKFVVSRKGIDACRRLVHSDLVERGVDPALLHVGPIDDCGPPSPGRPLADPDPRGMDGTIIEGIKIPRGEISFHSFHRLAELTEMYGDKLLRTTNRQNIEIHGVRPGDRDALNLAIGELGLETEGFFGLTDVVTCVGTTYCPLAVTRTHDLYDRLHDLVRDDSYLAIRDAVLVNVTGCPNACSPYRIADLGFRGARLRTALGSVEGYEISIGGTQTRHGELLGSFNLDDCVAAARMVLDTFAGIRKGSETLADNVARVGMQPYRSAVATLGTDRETAPPLSEYSVDDGDAASALDAAVYDKDVPCAAACPAGTRVPQYIERIAAGDPDGAYRINQEDNVFPGVLGRVCSRPCEPACRHNVTGTEGEVRICHLKRYASDGRSFVPAPLDPWFAHSGKSVAIVGSGPSGLAAARELKRYGHDVTVFESEQVLGGMMRLAIPAFRLPREVLEPEVAAVMDSGILARTGEWVNRERVASLLDEFDAVLLAAGAIRPQRLDLPGMPEGMTVAGVTFMKAFNLELAEVPEAPVVVVGGGFTAVDCARAARRLLGPDGGDVELVYRRTEAQMSAGPAELDEIRNEGIHIRTLLAPVSARVDDGRLRGVTFQRMMLTDNHGKNGKPGIVPLEGSEFEKPCGTLVAAIGQSRVIEIFPEGTRVDGTGTSVDGLFVAGDVRYGSLDVIHAVADGKAAADNIDRWLMGRDRRRGAIRIETNDTGWTGRLRDHDLTPSPAMPTLDPASRTAGGEVDLGFNAAAAGVNAMRCYLCNYKYEIDQDRCIHCDWCIKVMPRDCIRKVRRIFHDEDGSVAELVETDLPRDATYIWIDSENCIRCGACLRACPTDAISCRRTEPVFGSKADQ